MYTECPKCFKCLKQTVVYATEEINKRTDIFPGVSFPNLILTDGNHKLISNRADSFYSNSWQANASSVSLKAYIESFQLICYHSDHGGGFAPEGDDGLFRNWFILFKSIIIQKTLSFFWNKLNRTCSSDLWGLLFRSVLCMGTWIWSGPWTDSETDAILLQCGVLLAVKHTSGHFSLVNSLLVLLWVWMMGWWDLNQEPKNGYSYRLMEITYCN